MNKNRIKLLLLIILIIGAGIRLTGIGTNISYGGIYHPDTPKQIRTAWDFINGIYYTQYIASDYRGYPMFMMHLVEWIFRLGCGLYFTVLFILGMHNKLNISQFNILYLYLITRVLLAIFSTLTIYFIYKIGAILFNPKTGLLAGLLFSLCPLSSALCHYAMSDTAMIFFAVVATYFSSMIITKGNLRYYLLAGLFTMFSFSAKYNGAIIGILPILALLYRRERILSSICLLSMGGILGFFIGNPHMLLHFREGMTDIICFMKFISATERSYEGLTIAEFLIARLNLWQNIKALIGSLQFPAFILSVTALLYTAIRPKFKYIFISSFPIIYLALAFYGKPSFQPLYLLTIFPHLFILIGALLNSAHKLLRLPLYGLYIFSVFIYSYHSFTEDYFFWHKDTRRLAEEWVGNNCPSQSNISTTGYSISNPHDKQIGPPIANFFVSSSLSGMPMPQGAIVIKDISLENKIPPTIHRNPDIKILAIPGKGIKKGFWIPEFGKPINKWPDPISIFLNGVEIGPSKENIILKQKEKNSITYVTKNPIKEISATITSGNSKAKIKIVAGGKKKVLKLRPNETQSITFKNPRRGFPHTKYFYKIYIKNIKANEALIQLEAKGNGLATKRPFPAKIGSENFKKEFYKLTKINPDILKIINTQTFEAEEMIYEENDIIKSNLFSNNYALILEPEEKKNLLWGPYQFYAKGYYEASFALRAPSETSIKIEVSASAGENILAEKELTIQKTNSIKEIRLPFEIKETAGVLEFRVKVIGEKPIFIDKIDIYPALPYYISELEFPLHGDLKT